MGDSDPAITVGNRVLFVGGPEAGNIRVIPDSHGEYIKSDGDYIYRIWPVKMSGQTQAAFFAFAADQHPIGCFLEMWREYSPVAQIKRGGTEARSYQRVGGK